MPHFTGIRIRPERHATSPTSKVLDHQSIRDFHDRIGSCGTFKDARVASDGLLTVNSVGQHHYAPATTLAGVTQAIKTWSPSNWLMDLDITATNEAVGAPPETFQVKTRAGEPLTSTELVDISAHHESVVDDYTHFPEVADVQPQVSLADLRSLRETANIVKTYVNTADVLRALEAGEQ